MPLARAMARPASEGLHRLAAPAESCRPGAVLRGAVMVAGGWVGHDGGLALDRLAGAELEVGQDQLVLHGFVILLGPAAQPVQADDPGHVGGRQRAVSRGVPGLPGTGVVRKQRPAVVGRGHRLRQRGRRLVAVPRRRQGDDVIPQRPTLRTADKKVTAAGRPAAVGV